MSKTTINWARINNNVNGNPRYVCHFLNFILDSDRNSFDISGLYDLALKRAKKLGGKKFHNKQYGGGIVFVSYSLPELENRIAELLSKL